MQLNSAMTMKPERHSESTALFARNCNAFAVAMYRRLQQGGEYLFFSPFSLWVAISMAYSSTNGETKEEPSGRSISSLSFVLVHDSLTQSGAILFFARMVDPTKGS